MESKNVLLEYWKWWCHPGPCPGLIWDKGWLGCRQPCGWPSSPTGCERQRNSLPSSAVDGWLIRSQVPNGRGPVSQQGLCLNGGPKLHSLQDGALPPTVPIACQDKPAQPSGRHFGTQAGTGPLSYLADHNESPLARGYLPGTVG